MGIEQDIDLLDRVPMLQLLGRDALRILAISADRVEVAAGDELYREGDSTDGAFAVTQGAFVLKSERGAPVQDSAVARPGALLGGTALLVRTTRLATATAIEASAVLRIPRNVFLRMLEGEPQAAAKLRTYLAKQVGTAIKEIETVRPAFQGAAASEPEAR